MGIIITNLDAVVNNAVTENVDIQATQEAKQVVLDAVIEAQKIVDDGLVAITNSTDVNKIVLDTHTIDKKAELSTYSTQVADALADSVDVDIARYDSNAVARITQYNDNYANTLLTYNANDAVKLQQYNENHIERLENINYAYADRIVDLLNTKKTLGVVDEYTAKEPTKYAKFLDTTGPEYLYYLNGVKIYEGTDFIVKDNKTIELVQPIVAYDVIFQIDLTLLEELLINNHVLIEPMKGTPNGVASLDENALVPASQLPSYVDDVIEVATYADLPTVGESGKIYVVVADETSMGDTSSYRWTGTTYAMVSNTLNAADVKALYEANPDTNAYTDAEKFKLTSVEYGATADQTASEIETLYESNVNTNKYTDAEKSRIDINTNLTTTAQTLPTAVNEIDNRVANIEDNTTLAEYGIVDAYTKTEVQTALPKVGFDLAAAQTVVEGQLAWNATDRTLDLGLGSDVVLQVGQEQLIGVQNYTGSTITNLTVCMYAGSIGNSGNFRVAPFSGTDVKKLVGVATEDIPNGAVGFVTTFGKIRGVDTRAWSVGAILYLGSNGSLTSTVPTSGLKVAIAVVISSNINGTIFVRVNIADENAYEPANANIQTHITDTNNPHSVTKTQVGLSNVDNTADSTKNVLSAAKWTTVRTITLDGDVAGSVSVDGSANVTMTTTIQPNSIELGTDTTGNYVAGLTQGTGITVSGTAGEGWSPTVAITNVGTAGTYTKVTTNAQGQVTSGTILNASDIPALDASKITSGVIDPARLPSYVDDVLEYVNLAGFPVTGETGKIYVAQDTNKIYRWSGSAYIEISPVAGNADTATKLATARTIGGVSFDGSADINLPGVNTTGNQNTTGNAATVTNGVYTIGDQTISGVKTFSSSPIVPTPTAGDSSTKVATTAFVKAEIASEAYSKVELDAGQLDNRYFTETELLNGSLDNRYFTETELLNGALDDRYYTELEIDAKLDAENDASEISVTPQGNLSAETVQSALEELQEQLDTLTIVEEW